MKERPILFSGPMVRAILEGRKTQTRRVVKPQPELRWNCWLTDDASIEVCRNEHPKGDDCQREFFTRCPFGQPGDRLWVRETWSARTAHFCGEGGCECCDAYIKYEADGDERQFTEDEIPPEWSYRRDRERRPSIHMPRWASRITLEITGVRVERLQEISEGDARAEGADPRTAGVEQGEPLKTHRTGFVQLWASINGIDSWFANPWVWVVEFRRVADQS